MFHRNTAVMEKLAVELRAAAYKFAAIFAKNMVMAIRLRNEVEIVSGSRVTA